MNRYFEVQNKGTTSIFLNYFYHILAIAGRIKKQLRKLGTIGPEV
jgi:hypothetical protein